MSPRQRGPVKMDCGFPRVSGDEPFAVRAGISPNKFSPRERG